jgi:hypothetical protein
MRLTETVQAKKDVARARLYFGVPKRRHVAYQLGHWLPWFIARYVFFFQSSATLKPLYQPD